MSVKLRLARGGAKKKPFYRIVAASTRSPRDGDFLEKLGTYDPQQPDGDDRRLVLKQERISYWLSVGAQPTERVAKFLRKAGLLKTPAPKYTVFKKSKKEAKAEASA